MAHSFREQARRDTRKAQAIASVVAGVVPHGSTVRACVLAGLLERVDDVVVVTPLGVRWLARHYLTAHATILRKEREEKEKRDAAWAEVVAQLKREGLTTPGKPRDDAHPVERPPRP